MVKGSSLKKDTAIFCIYNNKVTKYIRQKLTELQRKVNESTGELNSLLIGSRQKIRTGRVELNSTISQLDLTKIYLIPSNNSKINILLSSLGTLTKITF